MITVNVNNSPHEFQEQISLQEVVRFLKINEDGIAIAINQSIITKKDWITTKLQTNDSVLIIQATQGG